MDTIVVGGGIAGLSVAREMLRRGHDVIVLEAQERVGGNVQTSSLDGALMEHGPQGFLGERPGVLDAVDELGLRDRLLPASDAAKTRYLLSGGKLVALPLNPVAFLRSPLLSFPGRLRVLREPWAKGPPDRPETIREFAARRIGPEAADKLLDAVVTGIFAGDPSRLSVDACFPKMKKLEREHGGLIRGMMARKKAGGPSDPAGSRLHSFTGGMRDLVDATARPLAGRIRTGTRAVTLARNGDGWRVTTDGGDRLDAERVVVALPPSAAAGVLGDVAPDVGAALREIHSAAVAVVGLVYERSAVGHPLDGYGFLAAGGREPVLGCLFESSVFPNRAPAGRVMLRAMVGGARNAEAVAQDPERIVAQARGFLEPLLAAGSEPVASRCVVWPAAIPQYDVAHPARVERIRRALDALDGLDVTGAAYSGVSVNHLVASASTVADRLESAPEPALRAGGA
ncbi:MAG: protoporphyrinogen oxidase [Gemmatimonadetes bacterium]|nr:protoporphyrinogen oxidase [Gemmatimonadota bacterium]